MIFDKGQLGEHRETAAVRVFHGETYGGIPNDFCTTSATSPGPLHPYTGSARDNRGRRFAMPRRGHKAAVLRTAAPSNECNRVGSTSLGRVMSFFQKMYMVDQNPLPMLLYEPPPPPKRNHLRAIARKLTAPFRW